MQSILTSHERRQKQNREAQRKYREKQRRLQAEEGPTDRSNLAVTASSTHSSVVAMEDPDEDDWQAHDGHDAVSIECASLWATSLPDNTTFYNCDQDMHPSIAFPYQPQDEGSLPTNPRYIREEHPTQESQSGIETSARSTAVAEACSPHKRRRMTLSTVSEYEAGLAAIGGENSATRMPSPSTTACPFPSACLTTTSGHERSGKSRAELRSRDAGGDTSHRTSAAGPGHGSASTENTSSGGFTALHLAAKNGHSRVVEILARNGANANAPDRHGWTPLHIAAERGHDAVVSLLLLLGADADMKIQNGTW